MLFLHPWQLCQMQTAIYYFYCMKPALQPIVSLRSSYEQALSSARPSLPKALNLALLSNPCLKTDDRYKRILHELTLYNKRILRGEVADEYETLSTERMCALVADLGNMAVKEDQMAQLGEVEKWWVEQKRIVKQRQDLGIVKYKTDKKIDRLRDYRNRMAKSTLVEESTVLPNQARYAEVFPFQMKNRTSHREMDVPARRLSEYKRKIINISETLADQPEHKGPLVTYPMPKKIEPPEEIHEQPNPELQTNTDPQALPEGQTPPQNPAQGSNPNPDAAVPAEDPNKQPEQANQDFGGGLGEQPGEPQEDEPEDVPQEDKLAPRNKIYTWSIRQREEEQQAKTYTRPYLFYRGHDIQAERSMEQRTVKRQQYSLRLQREEQDSIRRAHEWAAQKSKIDREIMQKLETMTANRSCHFSFEEPTKKEMLSPADQRKYGLGTSLKAPPGGQIIDLQSKLPELGHIQPLEREIRRDRLKNLKKRFSTILGLNETGDPHEISNAETMCLARTSPQRRNFSMLLEEHSLQREKALQLEEIQKIKESLGKHRININIRTLAQALVPDSDSYRLQVFASPPKLLPNNPFFVQPKKKKKKK